MEKIRTALAIAISIAFEKLLSQKHLYQSVEIDLSIFPNLAEMVLDSFSPPPLSSAHRTKRPTLNDAMAVCLAQAGVAWCPKGVKSEVINFQSGREPLIFELPTVNTFCEHCSSTPPFNPVLWRSYFMVGSGRNEISFSAENGIYLLAYQCQQCKEEPVYFLVHREGNKLRLAGRYPLEVLPTPKVLPKSVSKFYGNAMIAHHAGQTLAGLFLLRVFIEQFWHTVPEVQELFKIKPKATGDEQGGAYQNTLPEDFRSRFPSLTDIYDKLSGAIHAADENAALFDESCKKIEEHFDARRVFKIT